MFAFPLKAGFGFAHIANYAKPVVWHNYSINPAVIYLNVKINFKTLKSKPLKSKSFFGDRGSAPVTPPF
jgi:hypothetical protein